MHPDDEPVAAPDPQPAPGMSPGRKALVAVAVAAAMVLGGFGLSVAWAQTAPPSTTAPGTNDAPTPGDGQHCHHGDGGGTIAPDTAPQSAPNPST